MPIFLFYSQLFLIDGTLKTGIFIITTLICTIDHNPKIFFFFFDINEVFDYIYLNLNSLHNYK